MKCSARGLVLLLDTVGACFRRLLLIAGLGLLASCGGGGIADLAGGVGSGGSGLAEGTVTGFGSVIVDGVVFDDTFTLGDFARLAALLQAPALLGE